MPHLFDTLTQRSITFRNRIGVSPMCMYSCVDGVANDWHLVHLGARAIGGAGMVMVEATAVEPRGRISPADMGIWDDKHIEPLARVARFLEQHGAVPAIQLAHAGRKAGTKPPWEGGGLADEKQRWQAVGPSDAPFEGLSTPKAMSIDEIQTVQRAFVAAAKRALTAGFKLIELHGAHGYLAHSFYSPLSNHRTDEYGGSFDNRTRFIVETASILRESWPAELPMWTRLSCSDWADGGWTIADSVLLAKKLKDIGVDAIDCSSGGNVMAKIAIGAGYQVPFAEQIKREANIATAAVGLITEASHADEIVRNGRADFVLLARQSLRDPNFPIHAATALHQKDKAPVPKQYLRSM